MQTTQSTVSQGFAGQTQGISTKLSTGILDFSQIPLQIKHLQRKPEKILRHRSRQPACASSQTVLDEHAAGDLCTPCVMHRSIGRAGALIPKEPAGLLQMIDS